MRQDIDEAGHMITFLLVVAQFFLLGIAVGMLLTSGVCL